MLPGCRSFCLDAIRHALRAYAWLETQFDAALIQGAAHGGVCNEYQQLLARDQYGARLQVPREHDTEQGAAGSEQDQQWIPDTKAAHHAQQHHGIQCVACMSDRAQALIDAGNSSVTATRVGQAGQSGWK